MGYYLYDKRGYVGDLASNYGLSLISAYVEKTSKEPLVKELFQNGHSLITEELIIGIRSLHPEDNEIAQTFNNLLELLAKCDSIAIISDGVGIECPDLTIHRGTHEIGGSCIELCSSSGNTRIIFDIGLPLVNKDMTPFDWGIHRKSTLPQLREKGILPSIKGLYENDKPAVTAVVLSHAHLDHYGLLQFVHSDIPIYMSMGTRSLAEVSNAFLNTSVKSASQQDVVRFRHSA